MSKTPVNKAPSNQEMIEKIKADEAAKKAAGTTENTPEQELEKLNNEAGGDVKLTPEQQAEVDRIAGQSVEYEELDEEAPEPVKNDERRPAEVTRDVEELDEDQQAALADHRLGQEELHNRMRAAGSKLRMIAMDYPKTTPDEFVIFGRGSLRFTLGELRDLTNIR